LSIIICGESTAIENYDQKNVANLTITCYNHKDDDFDATEWVQTHSYILPELGRGPRMSERIQALTEMLTPVAREAGVALYDIEMVKEGGERILRLYIDKEAGVNLEDCERVSRLAEAVLDEHDPIPEAYALEVSSPGIERRLNNDGHFARYIGHNIRLRLYAPVENRKNYRGKLLAYENRVITIETEPDRQRQFPREAVAACRLEIFED